VDVVRGTGRLAGRKQVAVELTDGGTETLEADKIILATGSEPARPGFVSFDSPRVMTSDEALELTDLPESVFILGGGYIGCEFAAIFAQLGSQVIVVEMLDSLLPLMDPDIGSAITKAFKKLRIKVHTGTKMESLEATDDGIEAALEGGKTIEASHALICVGRRMLSDGLGLEEVGVEVEDGAIVIDEHCETSVAGIYAIGDVTGKLQLAHVASAQAFVAAECAAGQDSTMDYRVVPAAVFTRPEVGNVGLTEPEAKEAGYEVKTGTFPLQALGRAIAIGETDGFAKVVGDATTGEVLGVHLVGAHASDVIADGAMALSLEATMTELARTVHTHPTMAEAVMEAARAWLDQDIHA
ncbi:MAG: dihydrolipoyl dehydrogenase family protein, partial [bacterium]